MPIISSLQKLPVPPHAAGVVGTLNCCAFSFSLYKPVIISTTVSLFDLKDAILFLQCLPFFLCTLPICASTFCMHLMSLTDSYDDIRSQCSLI